MEIITGVERRRRWRVSEQLRLLSELDEPGAKFNNVARRHDLSRGLLWQWCNAHRCEQLVEDASVFLPVRVGTNQRHPASPGVVASSARPPRNTALGNPFRLRQHWREDEQETNVDGLEHYPRHPPIMLE
jgi:transposase